MNRIIITGNSGSGKSWLGKKLASAQGIPCISLDYIFWEKGGYSIKRNDSDVKTDISRIKNSENWIVEGVFGHLIDPFIPFAETFIFLNLSWGECRNNLLSRGSESSSQLDPEEAEENFQELFKWASEYETRDTKASMKYHTFLFESFSGAKYKVSNRIDMDQLTAESAVN